MHKSIRSAFFLSLATLATLVAGLVIGLVGGFVSSLVYVLVLFPLGMGLLAGFFLEKIIAWAKIRKAWQGILLACLMALAVYSAYQGTLYTYFRGQLIFAMHQKILAETGQSEPLVADALAQYALKEETGFSGFLGYLLYVDQQGITVGKIFRPGINLGPFFTWVFWLLEATILGWVTIGMGKAAAARPFCQSCNHWYGKERHLGGVAEAQAAALRQSLERRDLAQAGAMLEADAQMPSLEVYAQSCESCQTSDTRLALKRAAWQNGKLRLQPVAQLSLQPGEGADLSRALHIGRMEVTGVEGSLAGSSAL